MPLNKLKDTQCRAAKYLSKSERDKAKKHNQANDDTIQDSNRLTDGGGLYLEINKSGSKIWRQKYYRPNSGKENRLTHGRV